MEILENSKFEPYRYYNPVSDSLTVYFSDEPDYSKQITPDIRLYLSIESDKLVGCRIEGLSKLVRKRNEF